MTRMMSNLSTLSSNRPPQSNCLAWWVQLLLCELRGAAVKAEEMLRYVMAARRAAPPVPCFCKWIVLGVSCVGAAMLSRCKAAHWSSRGLGSSALAGTSWEWRKPFIGVKASYGNDLMPHAS